MRGAPVFGSTGGGVFDDLANLVNQGHGMKGF
jgi:hypothetical protein